MKPENNLDYLAAKHAQSVVDAGVEENLITKALAVLQEQGVYACVLYLVANGKENGSVIIPKMLALFRDLQLSDLSSDNVSEQDALQYVANHLASDLPRLLLAREALEQMLIYARYGAKARGKDAK